MLFFRSPFWNQRKHTFAFRYQSIIIRYSDSLRGSRRVARWLWSRTRGQCVIIPNPSPTEDPPGAAAINAALLKHGPVTRTTLGWYTSLNFHPKPIGGRYSLNVFNAHQPPLYGGSSAVLDSNSRHAIRESFPCSTPRLLWPVGQIKRQVR
ncbi:hypothetical protein TNCV_1654751 [Trichonephila clavipes]|nr:hypothetical protein TNCV_1654751 [Trichonephila clavipes]